MCLSTLQLKQTAAWSAKQTFKQVAANDRFEPTLTDADRCPNDSNAQKVDFAKHSRRLKPGIPSNKGVCGDEQELDFTVAPRRLVSS